MKNLIIILAVLITISSCTCFGCEKSTSSPVADTTECSLNGVCSGQTGTAYGYSGDDEKCPCGSCEVQESTSPHLKNVLAIYSGTCTWPGTTDCDVDFETNYEDYNNFGCE